MGSSSPSLSTSLIFPSQQKKLCEPLYPKHSASHLAKGSAEVRALPLAHRFQLSSHSCRFPFRFSPSPSSVLSQSPQCQPPSHPHPCSLPSARPPTLPSAPGLCCPGLFLTQERRPAGRQVTCVSDNLSQGGPGAPAPPIGGPGLARPRGGAAGRAQRLISCSEAAQQQKERDGPAAASGVATGRLDRPRAPRPSSGSRSYLSRPEPPARRSPPSPAKPGARCLRRRPAAGRAQVSAGGAGVQGRLLPAAPLRCLVRAPCPRAGSRAAVGALPAFAASAASAGWTPTPSVDPRRTWGAGGGGRADMDRPSPGVGRRLGVWFLPPPPSVACFLGLGGTSSLLLLLLLTPFHISSSSSCPPLSDGGCPLGTRLRSPGVRRSERGRRPGT